MENGNSENCNGRGSALFCLDIPDVGDFSSCENKMHSGIGGELKKSGTERRLVANIDDSSQICKIPAGFIAGNFFQLDGSKGEIIQYRKMRIKIKLLENH